MGNGPSAYIEVGLYCDAGSTNSSTKGCSDTAAAAATAVELTSVARFRPNLLVSSCGSRSPAAYDEDNWTSVQIGPLQFNVAGVQTVWFTSHQAIPAPSTSQEACFVAAYGSSKHDICTVDSRRGCCRKERSQALNLMFHLCHNF